MVTGGWGRWVEREWSRWVLSVLADTLREEEEEEEGKQRLL